MVLTAKPVATPHDEQAQGRGRDAKAPTDMPSAGWFDILTRTQRQLTEDNLTIVAAGIGFYGFVAVVPALAALVAIYGLIADPAQVTNQLAAMADIVPDEAMPLLREQMLRITSNNHAAGISAIIGVIIALYSSASATKAMISGLNIAYGETEKRSFIRLTALAMLLTFCGIVAAVLAVALVAVLPAVLQHLPLTGGTELLLNIVRWPLLIGGFMLGIAVLFRFGPCRQEAQWKWISPGALVAAVLWLLGSGAFSLYVSKVGSYDKTYGPLGAVVVFLLWLYLSALTVLIGAELNAETERQTLRDTTTGPEKPLGERGATAADTVGPSREELRAPKKQ